MNDNYIPLQVVMPQREYIIQYVKGPRPDPKTLSGYGIFPGSRIKLLFSSPAGDPSAYEIMGTVLALRCEDSKHIYVSPAF